MSTIPHLEKKKPTPTGGSVAQTLKVNPYATPTGYAKPTQIDIQTEIKIFCGIPPQQGTVVKIEDAPEMLRHVCPVKPYFHVLPRMVYPVAMPDEVILNVGFYVHECGKLIIVGPSLSS